MHVPQCRVPKYMYLSLTLSEQRISHSTRFRKIQPGDLELLKTSSDPQIINAGVKDSEVKQDTVPMKGQRTLTNINLLLFVKTAWNFQL